MKILEVDPAPFYELSFHNAAPRGAAQKRRVEVLPFLRGTVDRMPTGVHALVVTSDLQGRERQAVHQEPPRLLGEAVCTALVALADEGELPAPAQTGVLLAGDFHAAPNADQRGSTGEVITVWDAFARQFRWVAGVTGNHDLLDLQRVTRLDNAYWLDGASCELDGCQIAGVSGITGKLSRNNRKDGDLFVTLVDRLVAVGPDIVCLHEGPAGTGGLRGNHTLRELMELAPDVYGHRPLIVCGHVHWPRPLCELTGGVQVLNVDSRVVVLTAAL